MAKGNGFSKFTGLFVSKEDDNTSLEELLNQSTLELGSVTPTAEDVVTDVENLMTAESIYKENGLEDEIKSIFKVEEIKGVLPANLPTEAKKASVVGMMGVSELTVETVLEDAQKRILVLEGALQNFTSETIRVVEESEEQILELEEKINSLRGTITSRKKSQEDQATIINKETEKIKSIVDFIK